MSRAITINVPSPGDPNFNQRVAEILEIWSGIRNNGDDRVVTVRDINIGTGYDYSSVAPSSSTTGDTDAPGPPTGVSVTATGINSHLIAWKNPYDDDLYYIKIWRGTVNSFTDAGTRRVTIVTAIGMEGETDSVEVSGFEANTTYYYWLTAVDWSRNESIPAPAGAPALYTGNKSINDILATLQGKIQYAEISAALQASATYANTAATGVVFSTNVRGHIQGMVYVNTGGSDSSIAFVTDNFYIMDKDGLATKKAPFIFSGGILGIDGSVVVSGTVAASKLSATSITALTNEMTGGFGTLTLTAGGIVMNTAAALTINSGGSISIAGGSMAITSGSLTVSSTGSISITSAGGLSIAAAGGMTVTTGSVDFSAGTDLKMIGVSGDSAKINFYRSTNSIVGSIYCSYTGAYLYITGSSVDISSTTGGINIDANSGNVAVTGSNIDLTVSSEIEIESSAGGYIAVNSTVQIEGITFDTGAITGVSSITTPTVQNSSGSLSLNASATIVQKIGGVSYVTTTSTNFRPTTNKGMDNGHTDAMWNNMYAGTYYDDGGGYNDIYDDIAILHAMKPVDGTVDVLDLQTLPDFCTNKADLKKKLQDDNYDMLSAKEIDEAVSKGGEMEHLVRRNVARFGDLTAGTVRQLDLKYSAEIARLETIIAAIQKAQPKTTEVANA